MSQPVQVLNLACNHCGANLRVKSGTQYVTCGYCGSQLMVHEDGGSLYTEVLNRIDTKTTQIEKGVEIIKLQNELERLDREYQNQTLEEKITEAQQNTSSPKQSGGVGGFIGAIIVFIVICIMLTVIGSINTHSTSIPMTVEGPSFHTSPGPSSFSLFPCVVFLIILGIICTAIFKAMKGIDEAGEKDQRETEYRRRRREILDAIERQSNSDA